tara:strand:- start:275 stop:460 length:186 start_codon:yes stop_codon:yes gene_type:complete
MNNQYEEARLWYDATGETGKVKIDYCVAGEWSADGWDKGVIVARAEKQADGTFPYSVLFKS